jgi:hypothetical protein
MCSSANSPRLVYAAGPKESNKRSNGFDMGVAFRAKVGQVYENLIEKEYATRLRSFHACHDSFAYSRILGEEPWIV